MSKTAAPHRQVESIDVTKEYLNSAMPGHGAVTYEEGYQIKGHQDEIKISSGMADAGNLKASLQKIQLIALYGRPRSKFNQSQVGLFWIFREVTCL